MDRQKLSKEVLDDVLRQLGKEFRKLNGKAMTAEIVMVGGAAIVAQYGFRDSTADIDAVIQASSALKQAANRVGDANNLANGWLNQDFKNTESFSEKIVQYSVPYRTYSNILQIRTLPGKYLVAMKLASLRDYKYDKSDIVGIINSDHLKQDDIKAAVEDLYGKWENLSKPDKAKEFIDLVYQSSDLGHLYDEVRDTEIRDHRILKNIDQEYTGLLNNGNIDEVLAAAKRAIDAKKEQQPERRQEKALQKKDKGRT